MSLERTCSACGTPMGTEELDVTLCPDCMAAAEDFTRTAPDDLRTPGPATNGPLPVPLPRNLQTVGDFEVLEKLGQGGMGAVYKARQISFDRHVALKILPVQFEDDQDYVARFQREAALAASLNHANLVRVYASGYLDGCHYIAMELVEGENVRQRLKRGGMDMSEALRIVADVARGLECGWQKAQLIHRDIKPSNIYIAHNDDVKLGDLGLAKSLLGNATGLTQTGAAMGTALYMSPEQARGEKNLDFRADIYSLGCTLYELLTGRPPYEGNDQLTVISMHLNAPRPAILKVLPNCPMPLVKLVGKMLKKHRNERHTSYEDLIAEIEWVKDQIDGAIATAPPPMLSAHQPQAGTRPVTPGPSAPMPAPRKSSVGVYAGIAVVVLAAGALVLATLNVKPKENRSKIVSESTETPVSTPPASVEPAASEPETNEPDVAVENAEAAWRDAFAESPLREIAAGQERTPRGILLPEGRTWRFPPDHSTRAVAVRVRAVVTGTSEFIQFPLFLDDGMIYRAKFNPSDRRWSLVHHRDQQSPVDVGFGDGTPMIPDGVAHNYMWVRFGGRVVMSADGRIIVQAQDRSEAEGRIALETPKNAQTFVQRLDYIDVGGMPAAEAMKILLPRAARQRARPRPRDF